MRNHQYYQGSRFRMSFRSLLFIGIAVAVVVFGLQAADQLKVGDVDATIISVHQVPTMEQGSVFYMRYLVVTDKETFICGPSMLNGKFNNSDIFFRLKVGEKYHFKVAGFGKTMFTDYRNIIEMGTF